MTVCFGDISGIGFRRSLHGQGERFTNATDPRGAP
ncbi:hypothetical protein ATJ93_1687 [Halopiger aswanensis]|uniref:Uncharacterized protein n=1 Tax=Halopiger aswanensis TaxID=148449 RepID=A0A419WH50_9EURY|nr:hypothetical protein ATJ93_1687 [Halopiger aswanensis]